MSLDKIFHSSSAIASPPYLHSSTCGVIQTLCDLLLNSRSVLIMSAQPGSVEHPFNLCHDLKGTFSHSNVNEREKTIVQCEMVMISIVLMKQHSIIQRVLEGHKHMDRATKWVRSFYFKAPSYLSGYPPLHFVIPRLKVFNQTDYSSLINLLQCCSWSRFIDNQGTQFISQQ